MLSAKSGPTCAVPGCNRVRPHHGNGKSHSLATTRVSVVTARCLAQILQVTARHNLSKPPGRRSIRCRRTTETGRLNCRSRHARNANGHALHLRNKHRIEPLDFAKRFLLFSELSRKLILGSAILEALNPNYRETNHRRKQNDRDLRPYPSAPPAFSDRCIRRHLRRQRRHRCSPRTRFPQRHRPANLESIRV